MSDSAIKSKPAQATKAADWQPDEVGAQGGATLRSFFPDKPLWTPEIDRKAAMVAEWMACDLAGAHIWGVQRTGKSEFAKYLLDVIPTMLEGSAVAIMWNFLGLKPKNADDFVHVDEDDPACYPDCPLPDIATAPEPIIFCEDSLPV